VSRRKGKRATLDQRVVRIDLEALEIAQGHDGFLRGEPEPVIVVGLYSRLAGKTTVIARGVVRFARPDRIPTSVPPDAARCAEHELKAERHVAPSEEFFAILCALEEDNGAGVRRAYELLGDPETLLCYRSEGEPDPVSIALPSPLGIASGAFAIELLAGDRPVAEEVKGDDWVGSAFVALESAWSSHRPRFRSEKNDWTALVRSRG
jgi:hypothetical protein